MASSTTIKDYLKTNLKKTVQKIMAKLKPKSQTLTLAVANWVLNSTTGYYEYTVSNSTVKSNYLAEGYMDIANQKKLKDGHIETYNGGYKIITSVKPTQAITMNVRFQEMEVIA